MFEPYYSGLVAVSSFRPNATGEVAANQLRAKQSWDLVFSSIILFGPPEDYLASPVTTFIPGDNWPSIATMLFVAAQQEDPVCILNADIVTAPTLKDTVNLAWRRNALAVMSQRHEFDPAVPDYDRAKVVDLGLDFFCAFPQVWRHAYKVIPPQFRIGHQRWDTWMLTFVWHHCRHRFFDITQQRQIFHPKHGDRNMPHHIVVPEEAFYVNMGFPPRLT